MLKENPPPSLREAHAQLGITRAVSYGNFPEIYRAITARHRESQQYTHQRTGLVLTADNSKVIVVDIRHWE
jgi:hypothetical protein